MKRRIAAIVVLAAGLATPALAAAPASAGSGTSSVGCSTGDSCTAMLQKMVTFGGRNYVPGGGGNTVVDITPPPCLWVPLGGAHQGSQAILTAEGTDPAKAPNIFEVPAAVTLANTLVKSQPETPGEWYELPANPADNAAQLAACAALPLYAWVPPGQAPPGINIPPADAGPAGRGGDEPAAGERDAPQSGPDDLHQPPYFPAGAARRQPLRHSGSERDAVRDGHGDPGQRGRDGLGDPVQAGRQRLRRSAVHAGHHSLRLPGLDPDRHRGGAERRAGHAH